MSDKFISVVIAELEKDTRFKKGVLTMPLATGCVIALTSTVGKLASSLEAISRGAEAGKLLHREDINALMIDFCATAAYAVQGLFAMGLEPSLAIEQYAKDCLEKQEALAQHKQPPDCAWFLADADRVLGIDPGSPSEQTVEFVATVKETPDAKES